MFCPPRPRRKTSDASGNGASKVNAALCGLRTSVFFVIRGAMGGFPFNRDSRRGIARRLKPQGNISRRSAEFAEGGVVFAFRALFCGSPIS